MSTQRTKSKRPERAPEAASGPPDEVVDRLAGLLPAEALEDAVKGLEPEEITGPGGLVSQLAGRVVETALGAELSEHLGYPPGQAPPGGGGKCPQRLDREDAPDRARARRGQDPARPQGHVRAEARGEAPDPPRRP
jgi:hypothetical protein